MECYLSQCFKILCVFLMMSSKLSFAMDDAQLRQIVKNAVSVVDGVEPGYSEELAFTVTTKSRGKVFVESFNPQNSPETKWELTLIDQRKPTEIDLRAYRYNKSEEMKKIVAGQAEKKHWLAWFIDFNTLKLLHEDADEMRVGFAPLYKDVDKIEQNKLTGQLVVSKKGPYVRSVEIINSVPVTPNFLTKVTETKTEYVFQQLKDGRYALQRGAYSGKGRIVFFEFDETTSQEYSDYSYVGK